MPVEAFDVSVPAGTLVDSEKLASAGLASPEPLSEAVQAMLTSAECHAPSADPQLMVGGVVSDGAQFAVRVRVPLPAAPGMQTVVLVDEETPLQPENV